jgi:hypothetical protein
LGLQPPGLPRLSKVAMNSCFSATVQVGQAETTYFDVLREQ